MYVAGNCGNRAFIQLPATHIRMIQLNKIILYNNYSNYVQNKDMQQRKEK
jgi:hypothetical protein